MFTVMATKAGYGWITFAKDVDRDKARTWAKRLIATGASQVIVWQEHSTIVTEHGNERTETQWVWGPKTSYSQGGWWNESKAEEERLTATCIHGMAQWLCVDELSHYGSDR